MAEILITLKLYSGIEKELKIEDYNIDTGLYLSVKQGTTLGSVLKKAGFKSLSGYIFFSKGHHISRWKRFYQPEEVSCLRVSGGG